MAGAWLEGWRESRTLQYYFEPERSGLAEGGHGKTKEAEPGAKSLSCAMSTWCLAPYVKDQRSACWQLVGLIEVFDEASESCYSHSYSGGH